VIIQCDFDGTIITDNLSVLLRQHFADEKWRQMEAEYMKGLHTVEQSNARQYLLVKEAEAGLRSFARQNTRPRPGFSDFVDYCRKHGLRFVIVSSGLDFYIKAALDEMGLAELELYCACCAFHHTGIHVSYTDPEGNAVDSGFKESYLQWLKNQNEELVYIGDGLSDLDAALKADHVFATGHLAVLLDKKGAKFTRFHDFHDVHKGVSEILTK
jgi:2-hydroxy-3-keto-5-methylthiopentenyl-1-phosphate phosphatase